MRYRRNTEEINFWAGYADCMLALFMIALLMWVLSAGITMFTDLKTTEDLKRIKTERTKLEELVKDLSKKIAKLEGDLLEKEKLLTAKIKELEELKTLIAKGPDWFKKFEEQKRLMAKLEEQNKRLRDSLAKFDKGVSLDDLLKEIEKLKTRLNDKPPIINLTEGVAREFRFPAGKASIPGSFTEKLKQETFPKLKQILEKYQSIDTLEIVGHTDGTPISRSGNLDRKIPAVMQGNDTAASLRPGSNADLGLMRALAIRNAWIEWLEVENVGDRSRLAAIQVRCYSAAQTIPPSKEPLTNAEWLADNAKARRIEIRFTQLKGFDRKKSPLSGIESFQDFWLRAK